MNNQKILVANSEIHGKGLFAQKQIKAGEIIGVIKGEKTSRNGPHVLWFSERKAIKVQCDLRFINHSDEPNACYYDTCEVIALRDITPGEEITHNYEQD